jgi:hypothetical protein
MLTVMIRDKVTTLQEQYNIEVFYENYRIFMEQQESIIIKRRQAISHYKHVKGLLQQKREEEMKSRMKLNNLKRDVEKKGKELDKIKGKYDVSRLDVLFVFDIRSSLFYFSK